MSIALTAVCCALVFCQAILYVSTLCAQARAETDRRRTEDMVERLERMWRGMGR